MRLNLCVDKAIDSQSDDVQSELAKKRTGRGSGGGLSVTAVSRLSKCSIWNYQASTQQRFLKVTVALPTMVTPARSAPQNPCRLHANPPIRPGQAVVPD
jgi:hypothetical protein